MKTVRLRVQRGQLVGVAPSNLGEGAIVEAVLADRDDELPAAELAALNRVLDESWAQLEAGHEVSADEAIAAVSAVR